jgi:hypothetical protein
LLEAVAQDGGFDLDAPYKYWMDAILTCNAPFFGEVISLSEPFACYRIHAENLDRLTVANAGQFTRLLKYFADEIDILHDVVGAGVSRSIRSLPKTILSGRLSAD